MYYIDLYDLPEEVAEAIVEKREQEEYEKYVERLQYLENHRMTVDKDAELSANYEEISDFDETHPDEQLYREEAIKRVQYLKEKFEK